MAQRWTVFDPITGETLVAETKGADVTSRWQDHLGECIACQNARDVTMLCELGRSFWQQVDPHAPERLAR